MRDPAPAMPLSSPGTVGPADGGRGDRYATLLVQKNGSSRVFQSHLQAVPSWHWASLATVATRPSALGVTCHASRTPIGAGHHLPR